MTCLTSTSRPTSFASIKLDMVWLLEDACNNIGTHVCCHMMFLRAIMINQLQSSSRNVFSVHRFCCCSGHPESNLLQLDPGESTAGSLMGAGSDLCPVCSTLLNKTV